MSLLLIYFDIYFQMDIDPPLGIQESLLHLDFLHLLGAWYPLLTLQNQVTH